MMSKKRLKHKFLVLAFITILGASSAIYWSMQDNWCVTTGQEGNPNFESQNLEDYILAMIFKEQGNGFYIDIGANDGEHLNVTKYFYKRGWQGINIEPSPPVYKKLIGARPNDININVGVSDRNGEMEFYYFYNVDPLSTFNREVAEMHVIKSKQPYAKLTVPIKTIDSILKEHKINRPIDLVKIDVEGHERQVLNGFDFKKYRPKVFVLEATLPSSLIPVHQDWEEILTTNNYVFIINEHINRYYIAKEALDKLYPNIKKAAKCLRRIKEKTANKELWVNEAVLD